VWVSSLSGRLDLQQRIRAEERVPKFRDSTQTEVQKSRSCRHQKASEQRDDQHPISLDLVPWETIGQAGQAGRGRKGAAWVCGSR